MIARSNIPLYEQVKDDILNKIKDSTYKKGEKIPSERVLSDQYGVSRVTIRNTINELVYLGLLVRRHGSGTYVRENSIESSLTRMTSLAEVLEKMGKKVDIELIHAEYVEPEDATRKRLEMGPTDKSYRIVRRFLADGKPIVVSYINTYVEVGRKLENLNMNKDAILAALEDFGYQIRYAKENIRAIRANDFEMDLLGIDSETPVLCTERVVYVSQDKPLYFTHEVYHGERFSLNVTLQR